MNTTEQVWLTQQAYDRLQAELAALLDEPRLDDEDQALATQHRRSRIRELQELLHRAVVGHVPPDDGIAEPGMVLTIQFDDEQPETFLLGSRDGADAADLETYSPDSPLGTALLGAKQGEHRTYVVPNGRTAGVTLLRAVPYGDHEPAQP